VLEPGPVPPIDLTQFDLTEDPPEFEDYELGEQAQLAALDSEIDSPLLTAGEAAGVDVAAAIVDGPAGVAEEMDGQVTHTPVYGIDDAYAATTDEVEPRILSASAEMPPESVQPIPAPWTPPPETGGFYPTDDPLTPPGQYPPSQPQPPGPIPWVGAPFVDFQNISRPGRFDFRVGDVFQIWVFGPTFSQVEVEARRAPAPWSRSNVGATDMLGRYWLQGTMDAGHIGTWEERWYVGNVSAPPTLYFTVS
jgi:hypothetical protein